MKILLSGGFACVLSVCTFAQISNSDSLKIEIEPLGMTVNSSFDDYGPVISPKGDQLYFTSRRPFSDKEKLKGQASTESIFQSKYDANTDSWSISEALPATVNISGKNNSIVSISKDGTWMLVYQDVKGNGDIFESTLINGVWSELKPLSPTINTSSHESSASISPDGKTVYFVSDRTGSIGKKDIWQTTRYPDGTWTTAKNLGKLVNSSEDEEAVFIHPDGKTLYFSSKGHNSSGGYDVFKTIYENDEWSKPVSMGQPINTNGDDLFFVITANNKKAFYASSSGSGDKNIYEITFTSKVDKQHKLGTLKGIITSKKLQDPMEAKVVVTDLEANKTIGSFTSDEETGRFSYTIPMSKNIGITISAPNYAFLSDNVMIDGESKSESLVKNYELQKIEKGAVISLKNIYFEPNNSLNLTYKSELNNIFQLMAQNSTLVIELSAHTDVQGDAAINLRNSENKVKAIYDYLTMEGIPRDRIKVKGYGESAPLVSEAELGKMLTQQQNAARIQNERLELTILSK